MKDTSIEYNKPESVLFKDAEAIDKALKRYGVYKYQLAQACGVHRTTVQEWEHDLTDERLIILNQAMIQLIDQKKKALFKALN